MAQLALLDSVDYDADLLLLPDVDSDDDVDKSILAELRRDIELYVFDVDEATSVAAVDAVRDAIAYDVNTVYPADLPSLFETLPEGTTEHVLAQDSPLFIDPNLFWCCSGQPTRGGAAFVDTHVKIRFTRDAGPRATITLMNSLRLRLCLRDWQVYWSSGPSSSRLATLVCTISCAPSNPPGADPSPADHQEGLRASVAEYLRGIDVAVTGNVWGRMDAGFKAACHAQLTSPAHVKHTVDLHRGNPFVAHVGGFDWNVTFSPMKSILQSPGPATAAIAGVDDYEDGEELQAIAARLARIAMKADRTLTGRAIACKRAPNNPSWLLVTFTAHDIVAWLINHPDDWPHRLAVTSIAEANQANAVAFQFLRGSQQVARDRAQSQANALNSASLTRYAQAAEQNARECAELRAAVNSVVTAVPLALTTLVNNQQAMANQSNAAANRARAIADIDADLNAARTELSDIRHNITTHYIAVMRPDLDQGIRDKAETAMKALEEDQKEIKARIAQLSSSRSQLNAAPLPVSSCQPVDLSALTSQALKRLDAPSTPRRRTAAEAFAKPPSRLTSAPPEAISEANLAAPSTPTRATHDGIIDLDDGQVGLDFPEASRRSHVRRTSPWPSHPLPPSVAGPTAASRGTIEPPSLHGPPALPASGWHALLLSMLYLMLGPRACLLCILFSLTTPVRAADQSDTLTTLVINPTNMALRNLDKADAVTRLVDSLRPHFIFFSEFGDVLGRVLPWTHPDYHSRAQQSPTASPQSTGVFVRKTLTVLPPAPSRVDTPPDFAGRMTPIDVQLVVNGRMCPVRVVALYAPVQPTAEVSRRFWAWVRESLSDAPNWIIGGDLNVHLSDDEVHGYAQSSETSHHARALGYRDFLANSGGLDAWQLTHHGGALRDWTYRHNPRDGGRVGYRIIDRVASSALLRPITARASPTYIPNTNHRPAVFSLEVLNLSIARGPATRLTPRYRKPPKAIARKAFRRFADSLRNLLPHTPPRVSSALAHAQAIKRLQLAIPIAARLAFRRRGRARQNPGLTDLTAEETRLLRDLAASRRLLSAIRYRPDEVQKLCDSVPDVARQASTLPGRLISPQSVARRRNQLVRRLRALRWSPNFVPSLEDRLRAYRRALSGGSLKYLFEPPTITNPPAVQAPNGAVEIKPKAKLDAFRSHFAHLLSRQPPPVTAERPWLDSSFAQQTRAKLAADPSLAVWPQPMSMADLRMVLGSGNRSPSPGPDGIEKWMLTHGPESLLEQVLDICNYAIEHNSFPDELKGNYLTPLYKKGDPSLPTNYRGIVFANCIHSVLAAWLARCLQQMAWSLQLLPPTQIATQKGVRASDLTAFLSMVHRLARSTGRTVFAIKRDHTKGFDFLDPAGFEDVVRAYGLPPQLVEFERARAAHVSLMVKTQDGFADAFHTDGQLKQGDSASPIKYTLTMSLLHHWLMDEQHLIPRLVTVNHDARHVPADAAELILLSVEAMDDSILFADSVDALRDLVLMAERFQAPYGIQTAWGDSSKTSCFVFGRTPAALRGQASIPLDLQGSVRFVPLLPKAVLLRTTIDDPAASKARIAARIADFPMPSLPGLPPAVLRKALWGVLIPSIRALLQLQPVRAKDARDLDDMITRKWCAALNVPSTTTPLLFLPLDRHGFDLPSVERLNDEVAVESLVRMLNHHLRPFSTAAAMVLANWSCNAHHKCNNPLHSLAAESTYPASSADPRVPTSPSDGAVPRSWLVARDALRRSGLVILETDQSPHLRGTTSATHLLRKAEALNPGLQFQDELRHMGKAVKTLPQLMEVFPALADVHWPSVLSPLDPSLFRARNDRSSQVMTVLTPLRLPLDQPPPAPHQWASDGSLLELNGSPSLTGAVAGPRTLQFRLPGLARPFAGQAELVGVASAIVGAAHELPPHSATPHVHTDYIAATTAVTLSRLAPPLLALQWYWRRHAEFFRLLRRVATSAPQVQVSHVKAHTAAQDDASRLNEWADRLAGEAHESHTAVTIAPLTSFMKPYVVYHIRDGYAVDTWREYVAESGVESMLVRLPRRVRLALNGGWLCERQPVSRYYHTTSPAVFVPRLQYLTRVGKLMTPAATTRWGGSATCPLCGDPWADEAHIFRTCVALDDLRRRVVASLTTSRPTDPADEKDTWSAVVHAVFFAQGSAALGTFWTGYLPRLPPPLSPQRARQLYAAAIRVTGALWGEWSRLTRSSPDMVAYTSRTQPAQPNGHRRRRQWVAPYARTDSRVAYGAVGLRRLNQKPRRLYPTSIPKHPPPPRRRMRVSGAHPHGPASQSRAPRPTSQMLSTPSPRALSHLGSSPSPVLSDTSSRGLSSPSPISPTPPSPISPPKPPPRSRTHVNRAGTGAARSQRPTRPSTPSQPTPTPPRPPTPTPFTKDEHAAYRLLPPHVRTKHIHPRLLALMLSTEGHSLTNDDKELIRSAATAYEAELRLRPPADPEFAALLAPRTPLTAPTSPPPSSPAATLPAPQGTQAGASPAPHLPPPATALPGPSRGKNVPASPRPPPTTARLPPTATRTTQTPGGSRTAPGTLAPRPPRRTSPHGPPRPSQASGMPTPSPPRRTPPRRGSPS